MEIGFTIKALTLLVIAFTLYIYSTFFQRKRKHPNQNPGFSSYPLLGTLPEFLINRHRFLDWSTEVLLRCPTQTAVFYRHTKIHGVLTANPLNVEYMLKTKFDNFPKGSRFIAFLQDLLGHGIFNSDGNHWLTQRKTASYEFNTRSLRNFVMETVMGEIRTRLIPLLEEAAEKNRTLDLQNILERFAFDNICTVAFNVDPGCLSGYGTTDNKFMEAFEDAVTLSAGRFFSITPLFVNIKKVLNIGTERKLKESISIVHEFADKIIKLRIENLKNEEQEEERHDLLSRFMAIQDSPEYLRDIIINFILAGRDTTSSALSWFFWLLSSNQTVENQILNEIKSIRFRFGKTVGESFNLDELREMNYIHASISEAMRLYPPVPYDTKSCLKDDVMPDGTFVGKDWFVTYHTFAMGRMREIWGEDCCDYKPERWIDEITGSYKPENPFKFPVFHAGPRMCLGREMAYIQMKSIVAMVLERFHVDVLESTTCPEMLTTMTLRMKNGLPFKVRVRNHVNE
ncbi:cytochrome P450 94B3-like [Impatiens glandulifera]|uniref:cytochrome P450 94B3-like n=1 Tax=Impatiens glandulifera TaxID=253017 RepID=UPI001FB11128|nr:cytochrome P450 94B3-like [Impatiens glandulifera]